MEAKKISLKTLAASVAAVLSAEILLRPIISAVFISPLPGLGVTRTLEIILLILVVSQFERSVAAIGLASEKLSAGIKTGLLWSACFGLSAGVLMGVFHAIGINILELLFTPLPHSKMMVLVYLLVGGVIGPVAEEIFFRGIFYGYLRRWGVYFAITLSTLVFVLPHLTAGRLPFTQLVGGIVFALAYERENNLMVPITIHCLGNLAIFSIALLA
jgi:membrane protease YdiL (CAAX protease family)